MPKQAMCAPSAEVPLGGGPGEAACTWARRPSQHFVHGHELAAFGFNLTQPFDAEQLLHNAAAIERALGRHEARCCEC